MSSAETTVNDTGTPGHEGHHDHPAELQHHFDTMEQQYEAGKLGVWVFLITEILFFSGLFCAFVVYKVKHPEIFSYASQFLDWKLGGLNTAVLIFSSLTMAWAVRCAQLGQQRKLLWLLSATLALHLRDRAAEEPVAELLGPGAKDMLRLAGSAPTVMAGILGTNWPHLREEVRAFGRRLSRTLEELERRAGAASAPGSGEGEAVGRLEESLAHVRAARASLLESAGGSAEGGRPELGGVAAGPADADRPDAGGPDTEGPGSGRSESRRPEDRGR